MMEYHIANIFCVPIDTSLPDFEDYGKKIKEPMDLLTIKTRIENNKYSSYEEWFKDMNLVFDNAIKYYGRRNTITYLAEQMRLWFTNLLEDYPPTASKWEESLEKNTLQLVRLLLNSPSTNQSFSTRMKTIIHKFKDESVINTDYEPPPPQFEEQTFTRKAKKEPEISAQEKPKKQRGPNTKLTEEEKYKIMQAVNSIDNENTLRNVLSILQEKEPTMNINEESVVYLNSLKTATLGKLKRFLQSINKL